MASPSNRNLYYSATVACLTGALFGYSVGFIGGVLVLPSFLHHFRLDELLPGPLASARSLIVTSWLLGAMFGVPLGIPVCNRLGRRSCLALCGILYISGVAIQLIDGGASLALFDVGRVLNGMGVGVGTLVSPM
jgi:MFS family permease